MTLLFSSLEANQLTQCDETRLLYDDGHGMQYGSFDDQNLRGDETVEAQHEHEALQEVIAKTSM